LPTLCADDCSGPYAVAAIHPLYSDSSAISDNRVLGSWVTDHDTMTILSEGDGRSQIPPSAIRFP